MKQFSHGHLHTIFYLLFVTSHRKPPVELAPISCTWFSISISGKKAIGHCLFTKILPFFVFDTWYFVQEIGVDTTDMDSDHILLSSLSVLTKRNYGY